MKRQRNSEAATRKAVARRRDRIDAQDGAASAPQKSPPARACGLSTCLRQREQVEIPVHPRKSHPTCSIRKNDLDVAVTPLAQPQRQAYDKRVAPAAISCAQ